MSPLYIAHSKEIAARVLDGEMMIMSARDSTLFSLNELGTMIWQAADGATSLEEIVAQKICPEYEVEPGQALKDAETFVRELAEHGILILSDRPFGKEEQEGSAEQQCSNGKQLRHFEICCSGRGPMPSSWQSTKRPHASPAGRFTG